MFAICRRSRHAGRWLSCRPSLSQAMSGPAARCRRIGCSPTPCSVGMAIFSGSRLRQAAMSSRDLATRRVPSLDQSPTADCADGAVGDSVEVEGNIVDLKTKPRKTGIRWSSSIVTCQGNIVKWTDSIPKCDKPSLARQCHLLWSELAPEPHCKRQCRMAFFLPQVELQAWRCGAIHIGRQSNTKFRAFRDDWIQQSDWRNRVLRRTEGPG